jgi:LDH2 family malate/lactate/ureidoglycolate dehydrogenase
MLSVLFMTRSLLEKASSAAGLSLKKDQIETRFRAVFPGEVRSFAQSCLIRAGATEEHAASLAELLVAADTRGHFSHGLNRLDMYVKEIESGICDGQAAPEVVQETPATAFVDGKNGIGPVVGTFCMDLAIKKAKTVGIAWVNCTGSNHYGIAGWYAIRAAENGLIVSIL